MRRLPLLLALPLALAACSSSPDAPDEAQLPAQSAFADGTCRTAAPDLLELGRTIPALGDDATVDPQVQATLQETQGRLAGASQSAEPELAPALAVLVQRIGAVRIRAVGNTYDPGLGQDLQASFDDVLAVCTEREPQSAAR